MLIARDALDLIFVGENAHGQNQCSDVYFYTLYIGFVDGGEKKTAAAKRLLQSDTIKTKLF